ncbi:alpha/beta fold hydrolase [Streptomyces violaceusniger]|uniref:alpha/beta fold hydrolase n=1 Tax=Streptomyces violaceusniger TaxID=68280 RepID=UPI0009C23B9A|nr:proline iminopeptidase [Streptomyces hygroscopicus]
MDEDVLCLVGVPWDQVVPPGLERDVAPVGADDRGFVGAEDESGDVAAQDWCAWEDAVIAHEVLGSPGYYSDKSDDALMASVRIRAHYFAHDAWLEDGQLLRDAHRLSGIPAVLIHGRLDLGSPLKTAWELSKIWPDAELKVIDDSGHTGSPTMRGAVLEAIARFGK